MQHSRSCILGPHRRSGDAAHRRAGPSADRNDLPAAVGIALGVIPTSQCPSIAAGSNAQVAVETILQATNRALNGC